MSKEKQIIEEMAYDICKSRKANWADGCRVCSHHERCIYQDVAYALYNAGYRKQSEVAREIFEELEKILHLRDIGENLNITALYTDYAELKKKYTEADQ